MFLRPRLEHADELAGALCDQSGEYMTLLKKFVEQFCRNDPEKAPEV